MAKAWRRAAVLACVLACAVPVPASADWFFTPFIGWDVAGNTTLVDFEYRGANRTKVTFGGSALLLKGVIGVEADYAFVPRFFQNPDAPLGPVIANSRLQTLTGSVVLAAPLALTHESLRPYLVGGVGWIGALSEDLREAFVVDENLVGLNVGGGAIGMLGARTGVRFDLRRFTNIDRSTPAGTSLGTARLNFWRATVGVTFRY